jgi:dihydrofolate reductase
MKVAVYIAASVDGFIAKKDGDVGWLHDARYAIEGEDFGYTQFMADVDCIVMGRNTYKKVLEFDPWPFAGKRVVVLSRSLQSIAQPGAELSSEAPWALLRRLEAERVKKVYLDGGKTIQSFLSDGLVHEITVTRIPILLGSGISLFGQMEASLHLQHSKTKAFANGFLQSTWLSGRN